METTLSIQQCPSCAGILQFAYAETSLLQCPHCGTVVERTKGRLIDASVKSLKETVSVIQPGTEGRWENKKFKVTGRFRAWMEEAVFNYWTIIFDDGVIGFLVDGYGLYSICVESDIKSAHGAAFFDSVKTGKEYDTDGNHFFTLTQKNECYKWEIEGEAWMPATFPRFRSFEFSDKAGRHIELLTFAQNVFVFDVTYVSFASLTLTNTRSFQPDIKELRCAKCSKMNTVKTFPHAQSYACIHCRAAYVYSASGQFEARKSNYGVDAESSITLGASGIIKGINYEVIGFALKEETGEGHSRWKEYTLFNPEEGYAFLSEYAGHWIYVREQGDTPPLPGESVNNFTYENEPFQLFNQYSFLTINAAGEFPYNLFNDGHKRTKEFISPPEVWILEQSNVEGINWYLGEHISGKDMEAAFGDAISMPAKLGIGAVEPKGFVNPFKIITLAAFASLILILVHVASTFFLENRVILEQTYKFDSLATVTSVSPKFTLSKRRSNLQFDIVAPVDNSWFELNATLVNANTGTEYNVEKGVEFYHGVSEGESWSEGNTSETVYLNQVPAGTYYLQFNGVRDNRGDGILYANSHEPDKYSIYVTYDTANNRNLIFCLILLLIFPLCHFLIVRYNEDRRWSNSPFSQNG